MTRRSTDDDWSQRFGLVVRETAPEVPPLTSTELNAIWVRAREKPRVRRWKRPSLRVLAAGVAAVGVLGATGVAAAQISAFSAFTGRMPADAEDERLGGPGERLDPSAPDFAEVVNQVTADIDFPNQQARESALSWQVEDLAGPESVLTSTGAIRLWTAGNALCAWSNTWAEAIGSGDATRVDEAASVVLGAHEWTAISDVDPKMSTDSIFSWVPELQEAVRNGDRAAARRALAHEAACLPGLAPALGLGKRW